MDTLPHHKAAFKKGLIQALLLPLLLFALLNGLYYLLEQLGWVSSRHFRPNFRLRTTALIGIAANAYLLNRFKGRKGMPALRAVVIVTFCYVALWMAFFAKDVMNL